MFRRRVERSEPKAFEELLSAHLDALYRSALQLCGGHRAEAEDLLQDAMLRAFEHFRELRDPAAGKTWLFTILVRTNLNRLRTQRRRAETLASDLTGPEFEQALASWASDAPVDELHDIHSMRHHLAAALKALDDPLRAVIWLSDVEGFRHREIAEMLSIPEGTVASRLFRARRWLRDSVRSFTVDASNRRNA